MKMESRTKPTAVEAVLWNGEEQDFYIVNNLIVVPQDLEFPPGAWILKYSPDEGELMCGTRDGGVTAYPGDWVIISDGEVLEVCKPDDLHRRYEVAG